MEEPKEYNCRTSFCNYYTSSLEYHVRNPCSLDKRAKRFWGAGQSDPKLDPNPQRPLEPMAMCQITITLAGSSAKSSRDILGEVIWANYLQDLAQSIIDVQGTSVSIVLRDRLGTLAEG